MKKPSSKAKLVYLLAASHSGSTLTAMLLGAHDQLTTVGELKTTSLGDPEKYLCSCRSKILECSFWNNISAQMQKEGFDFLVTDSKMDYRSLASPWVKRLLKPLHRGPVLELVRDTLLRLSPNWLMNYSRLQKRNGAFIRAILTQSGSEAIVDSSKIAMRLKFLLRNPELEVKVIRVVRDGRAVALTYLDPANFADAKDPTLRGGGSGGYKPSTRSSMEAAANEWLRSNQEAENVFRTVPEKNRMVVKYEDICENTENTLGGVFRFIGVDPAKWHKEFKNVEHHVIGNGMRLDTTSVIKLDDRWKNTLSEEQLQAFDRVAGSYNKSLGYE